MHPEPTNPPERATIPSLTRAEVAGFLANNERQIRAMARQKLTAPNGILDSEDVFASVARRLDRLAAGTGIRPRSTDELWALVLTVTSNIAVEKSRLIARARSIADSEGMYGQELLRRLESCSNDDEATLLVHRMALCLTSARDRQVLFLFLRGATFPAIAVAMQSTEDAVRKRWSRLKATLEGRLFNGELDD